MLYSCKIEQVMVVCLLCDIRPLKCTCLFAHSFTQTSAARYTINKKKSTCHCQVPFVSAVIVKCPFILIDLPVLELPPDEKDMQRVSLEMCHQVSEFEWADLWSLYSGWMQPKPFLFINSLMLSKPAVPPTTRDPSFVTEFSSLYHIQY